jgi:hypothetical protein
VSAFVWILKALPLDGHRDQFKDTLYTLLKTRMHKLKNAGKIINIVELLEVSLINTAALNRDTYFSSQQARGSWYSKPFVDLVQGFHEEKYNQLKVFNAGLLTCGRR